MLATSYLMLHVASCVRFGPRQRRVLALQAGTAAKQGGATVIKDGCLLINAISSRRKFQVCARFGCLCCQVLVRTLKEGYEGYVHLRQDAATPAEGLHSLDIHSYQPGSGLVKGELFTSDVGSLLWNYQAL